MNESLADNNAAALTAGIARLAEFNKPATPEEVRELRVQNEHMRVELDRLRALKLSLREFLDIHYEYEDRRDRRFL